MGEEEEEGKMKALRCPRKREGKSLIGDEDQEKREIRKEKMISCAERPEVIPAKQKWKNTADGHCHNLSFNTI